MSIHREQHFDALALIQNFTDTAKGGQLKDDRNRVRCTVTLIDGSTDKNGEKARLLPVTIFADQMSNGKEPPLLVKFREAFENKTAVAWFNIQGKKSESKDESTWSF